MNYFEHKTSIFLLVLYSDSCCKISVLQLINMNLKTLFHILQYLLLLPFQAFRSFSLLCNVDIELPWKHQPLFFSSSTMCIQLFPGVLTKANCHRTHYGEFTQEFLKHGSKKLCSQTDWNLVKTLSSLSMYLIRIGHRTRLF